MRRSLTPPLSRDETSPNHHCQIEQQRPPYFVVDLSSRNTSMIGSTGESQCDSRIDLRAGSIIRRKHQSKSRYLGCAPWLLLAAVLSFKFAILAGWLVREYHEFEYRCSFSNWLDRDLALIEDEGPKVEIVEHGRYNQLKRDKRQADEDPPVLDPRFSLTGRKRANDNRDIDRQPVRTSAIQLLQSTGGNTIRTKTIRNRLEPMPNEHMHSNRSMQKKKKKKEKASHRPVIGIPPQHRDDDQIDRLRPPIRLPQSPRVPTRIVARDSGEEENNHIHQQSKNQHHQHKTIRIDEDDIKDSPLKPHSNDKRTKGKGKGEKGKKRKGKKNKNSMISTQPDTILPSEIVLSEHVGHRRWRRTTKHPRHLVSWPRKLEVDSSSPIPPNHSTFLSGALDPSDPNFTNKGHIRGYAMKTASKTPPKLKISETTRLIWHMDEVNFTTLFPAGTVPTKEEATDLLKPITFDFKYVADDKMDSTRIDVLEVFDGLGGGSKMDKISSTSSTMVSTSGVPKTRHPRSTTTTTTTATTTTSTTTTTTIITTTTITKIPERQPVLRTEPPVTRSSFVESYASHTSEKESNPGDSFSSWKKKVEEERRIQATMKPIGSTEKPVVRLDSMDLDVTEAPRRTTIHTRFGELPSSKNQPKPIKSVYDRKINDDETPEKRNSLNVNIFGDNLQSFADSAICIARTLFDTWCVIQCLCCVPSFLSVCFPSRSFFVVHLVLDVLFLVVAFVFCSTGMVFSMVLFLLVEGMGRETLLSWTLLLLFLFALLLVYTFIVVITHRSWELLLESSSSRRNYRRVEKIDEPEGEAL